MNPEDPPEKYGPEPVIWTLRTGLLLMCVGVAWRDLSYGGPIFEYLWIMLKLDQSTAMWVVHAGSYFLIAGIPFLFFDRGWPVLLGISLWMGVRSTTHGLDEVWHPELIPLENAVRYLGPLALAGLAGVQNERAGFRNRMNWIDPLLRVAAAMTFVGHGLAALFLKGPFTDFILDASQDVFGFGMTQATAESLLLGIGTLDLLVALLILLPYRFRWVAGWMALWGLITSFARVTRYGQNGIALALLRAMNWAVPLALLFYWGMKNEEDALSSPS